MKNWFSTTLVSEHGHRIDYRLRTDVDEVLRFADELDVCAEVRSCSLTNDAIRTSVLDAPLREYAMAPVRHTAYHLHPAGTAGDRLLLVIVLSFAPVEVEAVFEVLAYAVPAIAIRVTWE